MNKSSSKNHWTLQIVCNTNDKVIANRHTLTDMTQLQAIKYFKNLDCVKAYMGNDYYEIKINCNTIYL